MKSNQTIEDSQSLINEVSAEMEKPFDWKGLRERIIEMDAKSR